ncbi:hypothetical protein CsSME_00000820 [Camellia sinensis var. sinensis]
MDKSGRFASVCCSIAFPRILHNRSGGSVLVASRLHASEAYPGLPSMLWKDFAVCLQFGIRFPRKQWIGVCSMSWNNLLKLSFCSSRRHIFKKE